jgi:hypothetical protein
MIEPITESARLELEALKERVRQETAQKAQSATEARKKMLQKATVILASLKELFADIDTLNDHYNVAALSEDCRRTVDRLFPKLQCDSQLRRRICIREGSIPSYCVGGDELRTVASLKEEDEKQIERIYQRNLLRNAAREAIEEAAEDSKETVFPHEWTAEEDEHNSVLGEIEDLLGEQLTNVQTYLAVACAFSMHDYEIPLVR